MSYECDQCENKYKGKKYINKHRQPIHEDVKYECDQCDYRASHKTVLKNTNSKSMRVWGIYVTSVTIKLQKEETLANTGSPYMKLSMNVTIVIIKLQENDAWKEHKKSIHEGIRYSCDQCDHKATTRDILTYTNSPYMTVWGEVSLLKQAQRSASSYSMIREVLWKGQGTIKQVVACLGE